MRKNPRQAVPLSSRPPRTISHMRFKTPNHRDDRDDLAGDTASGAGSHAPSTLPPAPFSQEVEVSGHEWWLESHMNAASNILCLAQMVDSVMDTADVLAVDRVRALAERLSEVRDSVYELYCDAADPRMRGRSTPDGALTEYITRFYG